MSNRSASIGYDARFVIRLRETRDDSRYGLRRHYRLMRRDMIYLLYGLDTYSSRGKLRGIISEFQKKTGQIYNISRLDAEDNPAMVFEVGRAATLFSPKELVVIENISRAGDDAHRYLRGKFPAWSRDRNLVVIFWEGEMTLSKNSILQEIKARAAKSQEFKLLTAARLEKWIENQAVAKNLRLPLPEKKLLMARHGPDLWAIEQELDKIRAGWSMAGAIRQEERIWDFADVFFQKPRAGFSPLVRLLAAGFEPIYLLGALASSLRRIAAAKKRASARSEDFSRLRRYYSALVSCDIESKTGKLPSPLPLIKLVLRRR